MNTEQLNSLLPWSEPVELSTKRGLRILRTAPPTSEFWDAWYDAKAELKALGIAPSLYDGVWAINWWSLPPDRRWIDTAGVELPAGLFAHQKSASLDMLRKGSTILADDLGLGKTRAALLTALVAHFALGTETLVLCPAGLKENWRREAVEVQFPMAHIEIVSDAKIPKPSALPYVLLVDEAHRMGQMTSLRTKSFLELAAQAKAVYPITGTPLRNGRPAALFPLLRSVGHPLGRNRSRFETRYCGGHLQEMRIRDKVTKKPRTVKIWKADGAENLDELRLQLADWMIRRKKDECLDLPPKTRVLRDVAPSPEALAEYDQYITLARSEFGRKVKAGIVLEESETVAMFTKIRVAASLAKVFEAIDIVEETIEQGNQIVVFVEFQETARRIAAKWLAPVITGEVSLPARQLAVDAFQAGRLKAFIATGGTGLGLTLTAANTVLLVDRPLTPGDADQEEDRAYRVGTRWPVTALWLRCFPIDRVIDRMLARKQAAIDAILDGTDAKIGARRLGPLKPNEVLAELLRNEEE